MMKPANPVESFEQLLFNLEEMFRRYDGVAENQIPEDVRCAVLVACCPEDSKGGLCVLKPSRQGEHLDREETRSATQEPSAVGIKESPRTNAHRDWSGTMGIRRV